ncbi:MAG: TlpA family protein disulfide reductase [bacterium]
MKEKADSKKKDKIVTAIIVAVILFLVGFNLFSYFGASIVLPRKPLPFIEGLSPKTNKNERVDLSEGKFVVSFWALWCQPCVAEIGELNKISKNYPIYGVIKRPFQKEAYNIVAPAFKNIVATDEFFDEHYISVVPTSILVENGVISKVRIGTIDSDVVKEWFDEKK